MKEESKAAATSLGENREVAALRSTNQQQEPQTRIYGSTA